MPTNTLLIPTVCMFARVGECAAPPTWRVHGRYLIMYVCEAHKEKAVKAVGKPHVSTTLDGRATVHHTEIAAEARRLY